MCIVKTAPLSNNFNKTADIMRKLNVIHCGTGVAGRQALRAIVEHPQRELVGRYADCAQYPAPHLLHVMGFGKTLDDSIRYKH